MERREKDLRNGITKERKTGKKLKLKRTFLYQIQYVRCSNIPGLIDNTKAEQRERTPGSSTPTDSAAWRTSKSN